MRDEIPCSICGSMIGAHYQLWEHLHPPTTEAEVKSLEWKAQKLMNRLERALEKPRRAQKWRPPLQVRLKYKMQYR